MPRPLTRSPRFRLATASTIEAWGMWLGTPAPQSGQCFRIKDIEHIFWTIEGSHIGHKLMVALELANIDE